MDKYSAAGRPIQKFRSRPRNVEDLLKLDILDDDTRRLLMNDILHPPPARLSSISRPDIPFSVPPSTASPVKAKGGTCRNEAGEPTLSTPSELPVLKSPPVLGAHARMPATRNAPAPSSRGSTKKGGYPSQLRRRVSGSNSDIAGEVGSGDIVTAMAARLRGVEKSHAESQQELHAMRAKYREMSDKYQKERAERDHVENLLVTLYDEINEMKEKLARAQQRSETSLRTSHANDGAREDADGSGEQEMGSPSSSSSVCDGNSDCCSRSASMPQAATTASATGTSAHSTSVANTRQYRTPCLGKEAAARAECAGIITTVPIKGTTHGKGETSWYSGNFMMPSTSVSSHASQRTGNDDDAVANSNTVAKPTTHPHVELSLSPSASAHCAASKDSWQYDECGGVTTHSSLHTKSSSVLCVDQLIRNARILTDHVGRRSVVSHGKSGGICDRERVTVTIYANGIRVNNGPLRPYGWPLCDAFLLDLAEGFYPYEFKDRYPDGFPIDVVDRSTECYPAPVSSMSTHGIGGNDGRADCGKIDRANNNGAGGQNAQHRSEAFMTGVGRRLGGRPAPPRRGSIPVTVSTNHNMYGDHSVDENINDTHLDLDDVACEKQSTSICMNRPPPTRVRPARVIHTLADDAPSDAPDSVQSFLQKLPAQRVTAGGRLVSVRQAVVHLMGGGGDERSSVGEMHDPRRGSTMIRHVTNAQRLIESSTSRASVLLDRPSRPRRLSAEAKKATAVVGGCRNASSLPSSRMASSSSCCHSGSAGDAQIKASVGLVRVLVRLPTGTRVSMQLMLESSVVELRKELLCAVPSLSSTHFELCVAVPFTILSNHARTLRELGFVDSVALFVHKNAK